MTDRKPVKKTAVAGAPQKSGLVVLVGRSNVGKSTLLNALVGTKVVITSPKPQTTRHVIHGVINDPRGQIVFADTPGVFRHMNDPLTARLNDKVRDSVTGVDAVIYVVDATRHVGEEEKAVRRMVEAAGVPKILVINKTDRELPFKDEYLAWAEGFIQVIELSALTNKGIRPLIEAIFEILPEGPPLYPPEQISNVESRFWLAELIREKIFLSMGDEVPYSTTVVVEETAERENGTVYIHAVILTTAERYKRMLVGHGGRRVKEIGATVRKELEQVTGRKHYLELEVRVDERWQERMD